MITSRLSDKPYYADITFRNGEKRTFDYETMTSNGITATFMSDKDGSGPMLVVILDAVQTIECFDCAITKGTA